MRASDENWPLEFVTDFTIHVHEPTSHSIAISFLLSSFLLLLHQEGIENTVLVLSTMINSINAAKMKPNDVSKK